MNLPVAIGATGGERNRQDSAKHAQPSINNADFCYLLLENHTGWLGVSKKCKSMKLLLSLCRILAKNDFKKLRIKNILSRTRIIISLVAGYLLILSSYGGITILQEEYHCSGDTNGELPDTSYSYTDSSPVSGFKSDRWGGTQSSAYKFGATAETGASREWAMAYSKFVFSVNTPILILLVKADMYSTAYPHREGEKVSFLLTDNLTNSAIESKQWSLKEADRPDEWNTGYVRTINESFSYSLITGHEYCLLITSNVTNSDGVYSYIDVEVIPEPSSTVLLCLGALGFATRRRRTT
jgi:hypothetical protein